MPTSDLSQDIKKEHQKYTQNYAMAKSILVINIDLFILIDDSTTRSVKDIWDSYTAQYKKKGFVF